LVTWAIGWVRDKPKQRWTLVDESQGQIGARKGKYDSRTGIWLVLCTKALLVQPLLRVSTPVRIIGLPNARQMLSYRREPLRQLRHLRQTRRGAVTDDPFRSTALDEWV
jgi:hypothetical protein